jgi:integrase
MSQGQFGAQGAITIPSIQAADAPAASAGEAKPQTRKKRELAEAYQVGPQNWSARARREGCDIFLPGYKTQAAAEKELRYRVAYLEKYGKPYGDGPDQTTVAKAMQEHALKHLPSLKGADQEARRINRYLRGARLATIDFLPMSEVTDVEKLPKGACTGKYFAVWLKPYTATRDIPKGLEKHRETLVTKTGGSNRVRAAIANMKMAKVTHEHLQDLVRALEAEKRTKATIKQEQAVLRRLFNHAKVKWHWPRPDINPAANLKLAGHLTARERTMSVEEQTRLDESLEYCMNDLVGPAVQLLTETAMRAEECTDTAKWGGVDWDKRVLHLEDAKAGARDVPLSPKAIEILKALGPSADPEEKIFGISYEALKAGWRRACERAGIADLRIQDLRHTGATRMAIKTGNIFIVQALTGHKTLAMVKRYVNVKASDVVAVMHQPEPAPHAASQPQPAADAVSQQALQAAMQMLQAAAAQLSAKPAETGVQRVSSAANDPGEASAAA